MRHTVKFVEGLGSVHFNQIWKERKKRGKKKMRRRKGEGEEERKERERNWWDQKNPNCPGSKSIQLIYGKHEDVSQEQNSRPLGHP